MSSWECSFWEFIAEAENEKKCINIYREKELAKVTIKKEDLELIMTEMEISRAAAERSLREHMGNVVEALIALTN